MTAQLLLRLLFSKRDTAARLGISVRTLENLVSVGEIIPRRIGKRCLFDEKEIQRFARRDHPTQKERKENDAHQTLGLQRQR